MQKNEELLELKNRVHHVGTDKSIKSYEDLSLSVTSWQQNAPSTISNDLLQKCLKYEQKINLLK